MVLEVRHLAQRRGHALGHVGEGGDGGEVPGIRLREAHVAALLAVGRLAALVGMPGKLGGEVEHGAVTRFELRVAVDYRHQLGPAPDRRGPWPRAPRELGISSIGQGEGAHKGRIQGRSVSIWCSGCRSRAPVGGLRRCCRSGALRLGAAVAVGGSGGGLTRDGVSAVRYLSHSAHASSCSMRIVPDPLPWIPDREGRDSTIPAGAPATDGRADASRTPIGGPDRGARTLGVGDQRVGEPGQQGRYPPEMQTDRRRFRLSGFWASTPRLDTVRPRNRRADFRDLSVFEVATGLANAAQ